MACIAGEWRGNAVLRLLRHAASLVARTEIAREHGVETNELRLDRYTGPSLSQRNKDFTASLANWRRRFRFVQWRRARRKSKRAASRRKKSNGYEQVRENVFLKIDDVKASGPIRVRITDISDGQFDKPVLTFHDRTQLSLNTTNNRTLARAYGIQSDDWLGREVELEVGEIKYRSEPKETILVKPISPPIENKESRKPDLNDEMPF